MAGDGRGAHPGPVAGLCHDPVTESVRLFPKCPITTLTVARSGFGACPHRLRAANPRSSSAQPDLPGGTVRKITVGLLGLALATGLGAGISPPGALATATTGTAPTVGSEPAQPASDELPNPQEDKRRELRERALGMVLHGKGKIEQRGASTVMKVGDAQARNKNGRALAAARSTSTSSSPARRRTRSSSSWRSSGTNGTRAIPTRTPTRTPPDRQLLRVRCTTRSPSRTATSTTPPSGSPTTHRSTTATCTSAPARTSSRSRRSTRSSPRVATASTEPSATGSRSPTTRRATAAATVSRAGATCAATLGS